MPVPASLLSAMEWRNIGPHRGGRVVAVSGHPTDLMTFYFGACGGGVWKTTDGGTYWENVSDGFLGTAAVGAISVAPSDPNVLWVGTGEACIRGNVIHGDGVYRSTDGGDTWRNVGLTDTRHIARIAVHPRNPDICYVAALGHAFGPNEERGVFRTTDGGATWQRVLFKSATAGAADITLDPKNPRILYASIWQTVRNPWSLSSGGPESGLWKSTDGGDTWTDLTENPGLPKGIKGRIGVAVSPAQAGRIWAIVEAESGGFFRSDDGGATWQSVNEDRELRQRPWYYMHVFADPQDADTCYILNLRMWRSTDGGKTFTQVTTPHGDNHDLWIDPRDPRRMIEGNDGGACVSFNGGVSWSSIYNQPTAQFYHVAADTRTPYRVYGTQQDNSAITAPSRSATGAIPYGECYATGSSESGHIQVRPDNPNIVYSGAVGSAPGGGGILLRYDHGTGQTRIITAWPEIYGGWGPKDLKHRFQWTYPILISPHDPTVLYCAGERVFRSTDDGSSWSAISPDLTRNDPEKLGPSGGPITKDSTGAEHYCTIFAFAESPHERGVFWAGSDDGMLHLSRDNGGTWNEITPSGLPEWTTITCIEFSPHDAATAYVSATRYKLDDFRPFLFKTTDYGQSWQPITNGLGDGDITRVIREDPERRGLLYCGTERGPLVSFDNGASWSSIKTNLPTVPVHDLIVKDGDLVAATHGRSFWILDNLAPLRQIAEQGAPEGVHLFTPSVTVRSRPLPGAGRPAGPGKNYSFGLGANATYYEVKDPDGRVTRRFLDAGANPPEGVVVQYVLTDTPVEEVKLAFLDANGTLIREFTSKKEDEKDAGAGADSDTATTADEPIASAEGDEGVAAEDATTAAEHDAFVTTQPGANRFVWNLRYPDAVKVPDDATTEGGIGGPHAPPGSYSVRLTVGGETRTAPIRLVKDPRITATQEDFDAQFELLLRIRDKLSETHTAINQIAAIKEQLAAWSKRAGSNRTLTDAATSLTEKLTAVEQALIERRSKGALDTIHWPTRLNAKLAALSSVVIAADFAPPQQAYDVFADLSARIDAELSTLRALLDTDLPAFNTLVKEADVPAVVAT